MVLVFSSSFPGELCQSRYFPQCFRAPSLRAQSPVCLVTETCIQTACLWVSLPHIASSVWVSLLSEVLLLTTLPSHTWNVGVWNKCFKDTSVCQCSAYKMPNHYKIIKHAPCRWLEACPHQVTDGTAGTPSADLIQPVVLRCSAPECCAPCHTSQWTNEFEHNTATVQPKCVFEPVSPSLRRSHDIYSFFGAKEIVQKRRQLDVTST